jgi:hypothetical protein
MQEVEIVTSNEILSHADDGGLQTGLSMVVHCLFSDIAGQLGDSHFYRGER